MIKLLYPRWGGAATRGGRGAENGGSVNGASMPPMLPISRSIRIPPLRLAGSQPLEIGGRRPEESH